MISFSNLVQGQPRGSFWVLEKRKAFNEVDNADRTWNDFVDRFPLLQDINPEIRKIGSILADKEKLPQILFVKLKMIINSGAISIVKIGEVWLSDEMGGGG